ncbi:MAG: DUF4293 family protein [Candidatus Cryptobacteroides sp.]
MLKKSQNIFLLIATILVISMLFCNFAVILGPEGEELTIKYYEKTAYLLFLIMLSTAQISALASFKVQLLQMRVSILSALLLIGFQIWLSVDFFSNRNDMVFSITMLFPLVAAILDGLASRAAFIDAATQLSAEASLKMKRK